MQQESVGYPKCQICGHPDVQRCGRCKAAYYCSSKCQLLDWKRHRVHCVEETEQNSQISSSSSDASAVVREAKGTQKTVKMGDVVTELLTRHILVYMVKGDDKIEGVRVELFSDVWTVSDLVSSCLKLVSGVDQGKWQLFRRFDNMPLDPRQFLSVLNFEDGEELRLEREKPFRVKVEISIPGHELHGKRLTLDECGEDSTVADCLQVLRQRVQVWPLFLTKPDRFNAIKNVNKPFKRLRQHDYFVAIKEPAKFETRSSLWDVDFGGFKMHWAVILVLVFALLLRVFS